MPTKRLVEGEGLTFGVDPEGKPFLGIKFGYREALAVVRGLLLPYAKLETTVVGVYPHARGVRLDVVALCSAAAPLMAVAGIATAASEAGESPHVYTVRASENVADDPPLSYFLSRVFHDPTHLRVTCVDPDQGEPMHAVWSMKPGSVSFDAANWERSLDRLHRHNGRALVLTPA